MGSRGRARAYGRPEPTGRDYDYVVFSDDANRINAVKTILKRLITERGYKRHDRPGGFLTASGDGMDISIYPTSKRQDILKAWALMESGLSKDEAWAKVDADKRNAQPGRIPI
jgi:hypothetical protein